MSRHAKIELSQLSPASIAWVFAFLVAPFLAIASHAQMEVTAFDARVSGLGTFVSGDESRFQERHQVRSGGSGGIENFYLGALIGDGRELALEGRALIDNHDYLARILLKQDDLGYLDAGYREFRHWYDGSGGFFPPSGAFLTPFSDERAVDRASSWFEAGLRMPEVPKLTVRYAHDTRQGRTNSLAWGTTMQTDGLGPRSIIAAFNDVDERRDRVALDIEHRLRRTLTVGGGARWEAWRNDAARNMTQQLGEALAERYLTQAEHSKSDLLNLRAYALNSLARQRTQVTTAYSYTDLDSTLSGSRVFGERFRADYDPLFGNRQAYDLGFSSLGGSSRLREHVGTLNALVMPTRTVRVRAAVRVNRQDNRASSEQTATAVESLGVVPFLRTSETPLAGSGTAGTTYVQQQLEVRYLGIAKAVLYARADFEQRRGDLVESLRDLQADVARMERDTRIEGLDQRYSAGANYYPVRRVVLSGKGYYENRQTDYDHRLDSTDNAVGSPDRFPAFVRSSDIERHGTQTAATWTLAQGVRLRANYDYMQSTLDTRVDKLRRIQSGRIDSHAIGGSASWSPGALYLHGTASYVMNETKTPASKLSGVAGRVAVTVPNDYVSAQILAGLALGADTEAQALYSFYLADNYRKQARFTQPFGADLEEHGISLGIRHRLTETLEGNVRYGFFDSRNGETGGFDDYDGHFVMGGLRYSF